MELPLVREDRGGLASGVSVEPSGSWQSSQAGTG